MGYHLYDSSGYVDDVASGGGWMDFRRAAEQHPPGPETKALVDVGQSNDPEALVKELRAATFDDASADSVRRAIANTAGMCKDTAILSDGVGHDEDAGDEESGDDKGGKNSALTIILARDAGVRQSHLDQYFGPWCVQPERFASRVEMLQGSNVLEHIEQYRAAGPTTRKHQTIAQPAKAQYDLLPGTQIAMLHIVGAMTKYGTSYGDESSTVALRRQVRLCMADEDVKAVLLRIESPGGTCAGTQELADDLKALAAKKPVYAWCEDLCCSAAYWIASQCSKIYANATAMVGCIGTYAVVQDASKMAEKIGVKVHVVKAGEFKGAGEPGTQVSDEQLAEYQRLVDTLNEFFCSAVASGRGLPPKQVKLLADGRVHVGQDAVENRLIDGVRTFEETINALRDAAAEGSQKTPSPQQQTSPLSAKESIMAEPSTTVEPTAASLAELKAALPGAKAAFLLKCLEKQMTLAQALAAHMKALHAENVRLRAAKKMEAEEDEGDEEDDDEEDDDDDEEDEDDDEDDEDKPGKKKPAGKKMKAAKPCKGKAEEGDSEKAKPAKAGKAKSRTAPGVDTVTSRRAGRSDSRSEFDALVMDTMKAVGCDRRKAVALVARQNPGLHEELLRNDRRNQGAPVQNLIGERFSMSAGRN